MWAPTGHGAGGWRRAVDQRGFSFGLLVSEVRGLAVDRQGVGRGPLVRRDVGSGGWSGEVWGGAVGPAKYRVDRSQRLSGETA